MEKTNFGQQVITNVLGSTPITALWKAIGLATNVLVIVPGLPVESESTLGITAISKQVALNTDLSVTSATKSLNTLAILKAIFKMAFTTTVSPSTFEDIWISESIPQYIAYSVINQVQNYANIGNAFTVFARDEALRKSWSKTSAPARPTTFTNISEVLQYISGEGPLKGTSILDMIGSLSSDPKFDPVKTLTDFAVKNKGKPVSTEDLVEAYQIILKDTLPKNQNLTNIITPWLEQTGYPSLTVYRKDKAIMASQSRFGPQTNSKDTKWTIPIYTSIWINDTQNPINMTWLDSQANADLFLEKNAAVGEVVLANSKGPGLYRVLYNEIELENLGKLFKTNINAAGPEIRAAFISDGLTYAKNGQIRYSVFLNSLTFLELETQYTVWTTALKALNELWALVYSTDLRVEFENYATGLLRPIFNNITLGSTLSVTPTDMLAKVVASGLCNYNDFVCRNETSTLYNADKKLAQVTNIDLRPVIFCVALANATATEVTTLLPAQYILCNNKQSKKELFSYLACPNDNTTIQGYLEELLNNSTLYLSEDVLIALKEVLNRPENFQVAMSFFIKNYNRYSKRLSNDSCVEVVEDFGKQGTTEEQVTLLKSLNYNKENTAMSNAVNAAIQSIQKREQFLKVNHDELFAGFNGFVASPTPSPGPTPSPTDGNSTVGPTGGSTGTSISATVSLMGLAIFGLWASA